MGKTVNKLKPDGSDRSFSRTLWKDKPAVKIGPSPGKDGLREAFSYFRIGSHLFRKGIPVPGIYFFDRDSGVLIVEDLGETMLFQEVARLKKEGDTDGIKERYLQVVETLILMQLKGSEGFDTSWCWQEKVYDSRLVLEREVGYFLNAFVAEYAGFNVSSEVKRELNEFARQVDTFTNKRFFLHRDFQSRNILVRPSGGLGVVDFQAGRLGPLAYDLASLLHDPYVQLDYSLRNFLFEAYVSRLNGYGMRQQAEEVLRQWPILSVLRLLQALGAYGFLIGKKGRPFFRAFIKPALRDLFWLCCENFPDRLPASIDMFNMLDKDIRIQAENRGLPLP